jgi:uncharacterized membrane protein YpjA
MQYLTAAAREIWHLFVEDGPSAAAIVLWPIVIGLLHHSADLAGSLAAVTLAVGMIGILVVGAARTRTR